MNRWYAVHCKPRQDDRAEQHLRNQGYETFRPLVRTRAKGGSRLVIESMFPRYLFVRLADLGQDWSPIRSTRGVVDLVRRGERIPSIPDTVIDGLAARLDEQGCIDLNTDFQRNQRLRIVDGPFAGYEAIFHARSGEERVIVLLNVLHQPQKLALPAQAVAAL